MLSCKEVAHMASDYLDRQLAGNVNWKIRLHLLACSNCRRFIRHLKITKTLAPQMIQNAEQEVDAESVLGRIKARLKSSEE